MNLVLREGYRAFRILAWTAEILGWVLLVLSVNEATVQLGLFPSIWPTSGVIVVLLRYRGVSRWPAPFLALFIEFGIQPKGFPVLPFPRAAILALSWTAAYVVVALAFRRLVPNPPNLHPLRRVVYFVVLAGAVGPALRLLAGLTLGPPFLDRETLVSAWAGDTAGSLVIAPPVIWLLDRRWPRYAASTGEALACGLLLLSVAAFVFGGLGGPPAADPPLFLLWIPLVWAALRFGVGGAALGSLAVAGVALTGLVTAPEGEAPEIAAFRLQIYLGVMAVCMLVLGAVVEDRAAAGRRLYEARQELDRLLRRRIREEREERDFGRLVLDTSRALVTTLDPQGRLTTANPAFRALTLAGRETDFPGPTLLSLVPEDERTGLAQLLEQAWRADAPVAFELALEGAAGERREFQWSARRLIDPEGQARLLVAGTEVTRRRQARREVERSLALVQTTLESIAEGILVVPAGGGEAAWNARFAGLWGIPVQPDRGPAALVFTRLREQVADPGAWDDVLRSLDPTSAQEEEEELPLRDGRVFERVSRPQRLGDRVVGRVWSFRDITARIRVEEERNRLLERTRQSRLAADEATAAALRAVAVRDDFLSVASHELRTPLTTLKAHLQRVRRLAASVPVVRETDLLSVIPPLRRQLGRLGQRLEELLAVGTYATEEPPLAPAPGDLREVVRDALVHHEEEASRYRVPIDLRAPEPVPGAWDATRLSGAIGALVSNAVKFGAGRPVTVEVRNRDDRRASIAIRDRGPGIDPSDRERIFGRFERSVESRHYGGFGLGLWFARRIVEASGGEIEVESEPGNGATFTVVLPLHPELRAGAAEEAR